MDGGLDPRTIKTAKKVNKMLLKAYAIKEEAWHNKMRYRAITWSCPPHYYANFSNWLANSWGINVLVEMESLNYTKHLNTTYETEALRDMARLYERMVMRRHTNGGYHNVVTELWRQCEAWNAHIVFRAPFRAAPCATWAPAIWTPSCTPPRSTRACSTLRTTCACKLF